MNHDHGAMRMAAGAAQPGQPSIEDHSKHEGHSIKIFQRKFYVSLVLTVPILALSPFIQDIFRFSLRFPHDSLVLLFLSSLIFFYGGLPFLSGAGKELKYRKPGMMTLISLAITVAYAYSLAVTFGLAGEVFFWELATLIDIMLLGHWLEMKSMMGASRALEKLSQLIPDKAHRLRGEEIDEVNTSELQVGDIILVKPGDKIPSDGLVIKGESFVNESMLTGESRPVLKKSGDKVIGGSINEDGSLQVRISGIGMKTYLSKVMELVKTAQAAKSQTQLLADRAASWLTLGAIGVGVITFIAWILVGRDLAFAIERAATVLIIACPHALGLAVPLVVSISTVLSAQNGLLIRNRTAFENSRRITTIIFDKTGTLTTGTFALNKIHVLDKSYDENTILGLAASLEINSEHPIARVIVAEAQQRKVVLIEAVNFLASRGKGVSGQLKGKQYALASPGYLIELGLAVPKNLVGQSATIVYLVDMVELRAVGAVAMSDAVRPESKRAVESLRQSGLAVWMLTGDNEDIAREVAGSLKLDGYFAGVLPDQKQEKIKELQAQGQFVAMVGDGINDAPALAQSNVGIAIGSGTDVAAETADIILVNSNPEDIAALIAFGKATYRKMVQNLIWATGYNIVAIPLAAGVLYSSGILLSPALGAAFMSLSTIVVAINAKSLKVRRNKGRIIS